MLRILLRFLVAILAGFCLPLTAAEPDKRPNIVFLIADDLSTRLGCYGDKAAVTPTIDQLAAEGLQFNRAYAQGSVCIPSRTSFMLGLNNRHAKFDHFKKHPDTMTLGRWFRQHGYETFSVGKVDHNETYVDPEAWDIQIPPNACKKRTKSTCQLQDADEDLGAKRKTGNRYKVEKHQESLDDWARTQEFLDYLDTPRQKPFFAAVGFLAPHTPWSTSQSDYDAQNPARFTLEWPTPEGATPVPPKALFDVPGFDMSESRQREYQRLYYSCVTTLDNQIARIMNKLRALGQLDNTIIVFTSDQGYHLGWRGQWHKHTISEQVLHVPLIVRLQDGSKNPRGAKADGIVELLDLFPTLCDLAGLPKPESLDGKSFVRMLEQPDAEGKAAAFCSMPNSWGGGRTVRTKKWRLIERLDGSNELYDLENDPMEYKNVITNAAHSGVLAQLGALLEKEFGARGSDDSSAAQEW